MIFALQEVGLIPEIAGWHVVTTHPVGGWDQWLTNGGEGYPLLPEGSTVNYVFPARSDFLRQLDIANQNGTFVPAIPPPIPTIITMRQTRLGLLYMGLLEAVEAAIQQLPEPDRTVVSIEWDHGSQVERYNPFVIQLVQMLGLTSAEADEFFVNCAAL